MTVKIILLVLAAIILVISLRALWITRPRAEDDEEPTFI